MADSGNRRTEENRPRGRIDRVDKGSPAAEAGLKPGDLLVTIEGRRLHDVIDFQFYLESGRQRLEVERGGRDLELTLKLEPGEDPGIRFSSALFDRVRTCGCKCVFCFVDQLPRGMRKSLYLKDDDYRLSFLYGNFVTLNDLDENDMDRMITQRLSPLYVSVHATDPAVRAAIMGCSEEAAEKGLVHMAIIGKSGIDIHAQVVLCPGINDGSVLKRTIEALARCPGIASVGVVPVAVEEGFALKGRGVKGKCPPLRPATKDDSQAVIDYIEARQEDFRRERGSGFVYAADEFYLLAKRKLPPAGRYDDFPQYENGVGIAANFTASLERIASEIGKTAQGRVYLLSGTLAAGLLEEVCAVLDKSLEVETHPLVAENRIFGPHVTVTGLLGGSDILRAVEGAGLGRGDLLLIPGTCLDSDMDPRFLDGMTLDELTEALACEVRTARF